MKQMYEEQDVNQTKNKRQKDKTCNFEKTGKSRELNFMIPCNHSCRKKERKKD